MPNQTVARNLTRLALVLTMAAGLAVVSRPLVPAGIAAQDNGPGRRCSVNTLRGDYVLLASGTRRVPPDLGGGTEPFNATGLWTFHGDGSFTQSPGFMSGLVTGRSTLVDPAPGTYTVNPDCSGTLALHVPDLPFPIEYVMVIADNAREVKGIVMSATGVATISLTRK